MQNEYIIKREETKMKTKELKTRNERGVTLIALVVTIALNCLRSGRKLECVA